MQLAEFFNYKDELMKTICSNREIVRLVTDNSVDIEVPNYDIIYSQVFPFEFVPETVNDGQTFICFDVDIAEGTTKTYYSPVLYIYIFTHKSKLRLPEGGIRTDQIASEIDKEINGSRLFGLGELDLYSVTRFAPITDYQGRVLTYYAKDFNRGGKQKPVPQSRRVN